MKIWLTIVKKIFIWSLNYLYNYIDKDDDGNISKEELSIFHDKIKDLLKLVKNKK